MLISTPFTSTAPIGSAFGKPSVFYDPSGGLGSVSGLSHGVPVVASKEALRNWLREQVDHNAPAPVVRDMEGP